MENKNNNVDRGNLKQNLSEKFVWAIAYGSCIGWGAFILPGDWIKQSGPIASSIGIVIGALLMILIAVSYGALVEKFPVSGAHLLLVFKFWKICKLFLFMVFNIWLCLCCCVKCDSIQFVD